LKVIIIKVIKIGLNIFNKFVSNNPKIITDCKKSKGHQMGHISACQGKSSTKILF